MKNHPKFNSAGPFRADQLCDGDPYELSNGHRIHLLLIVIWSILSWPWISGSTLIPYDSKTYHLPMSAIAINEIMHGSLPLWNQLLNSGTPLLSDPQLLLFSPLYMILMASGNYYSAHWLDIVQLLHILLAGIGGYLYCRTQNISYIASLAVTPLIMFGGVFASRMQHTALIIAFTYLPWVLLAVHYMLTKRTLNWAIATAIAVTLMAIHFVQTAFLSCILILVYVISDIIVCEPDERWDKFKYSVLAGSLSILMLILPAMLVIHHISLCTRPEIVKNINAYAYNTLYPTTLLTLIAPNALGSLETGKFIGNGDITEQYLYAGILTMVLLFHAVIYGIYKTNRSILFWLLTSIIATLYALGEWTPVFKFLHAYIPGVSLYRRPTDAMFILNFAIAMTVASFLKVLSLYNSSIRNSWFFLISITSPIIFIAWIFFVGLNNSQWTNFFNITTIFYFLFFLTLTIIFAILARYYPKFISSTLFSVLIVIIIVIDIFAHNINKPMNATNWPGFKLLERGKQGELPSIEWIHNAMQKDNSTMHWRVEPVDLPQNWTNVMGSLGFESTYGYNPLQLDRYHKIVGIKENGVARVWTPLMYGYESPFFNLLGIRYLLTKQNAPGLNHQKFPIVNYSQTDGLPIEIRENPRALPRVFSVTEIIYEPDFETTVSNGLNYPVNFLKQVILERQLLAGITLKPKIATQICTEHHGSDKITVYSSNRIIIESSSSCRRVLVINNIWHPDWQASVDNQKSELLRINFLFQGVLLEPGNHIVEINFNPFHFLNN